jgi:hypothetical protein
MAPAGSLTLELLSSLEDRWRSQGARVVERLRPGLTRSEQEGTLSSLALVLPDEGTLWWEWHDGAMTPDGNYELLGPDLPFLPLAKSVEWYREFRAIAEEENADADWPPEWFPLTTSSQGPIVIDCSIGPGRPTPIRKIDWANAPSTESLAEPRASSLGELVRWWIDALDVGAWRYDAAVGRWDYDWTLLPRDRELTGLL